MTGKIDPFAMEPIRANVLQLHQINKEVSSLETSIQRITASLAASESHMKEQKEKTDKILDEIKRAEEEAEKEKLVSERRQDSSEKRTSEVYLTDGHLPKRFEEPYTWSYKVKGQHPLYTTTTNQYGLLKPTVHNMPTIFKGKSGKFSEHLNHAGPYRNHSLNTSK